LHQQRQPQETTPSPAAHSQPHMRFQLFVASLLLSIFSAAQSPLPAHHRVVIEVATVWSDGWALTLGNAERLQQSFGQGNVEIEIVLHGPAVAMVHKGDTDFRARIEQLASKGVVFVACGTSLRLGGTPASELFPFTRIVDSGVAEVVRKQEAGWSYLKGGY
jgi:uncharacterized protein